jgi:hypothetical protein
MKHLPLRWCLVSAGLVAVLAGAPAPASAVGTVFFDQVDFGLGAGRGSTQATANNAGVPVVAPVSPRPVTGLDQEDIARSLDLSTLSIGATAQITSNWTFHNDTGTTLQNLYLVFFQPEPVIFLDGEATSRPYAADDIGIDLSGASWSIFTVVQNSIPVYYPAVSLGTLANGADARFPLHYVLDNPQVFTESFNFELGMPKWNLGFITTGTPIPEPATAWLVLIGLLAIARGRHKRS